MATHKDPKSWIMLVPEDILAYFGCMILMGLAKLPSLKDYWSTLSCFSCPAISERISRDRFLEIHKYLHFADNSTLSLPGTPEYDKIGKVRHVLNMLKERFLVVYNPHRECAIDEAMIKYKGRSTLKQYMPMKPTKRGMKIWMRADSHNGYVSEFQVYTGKGTSSECGLGGRIVKDLTANLPYQNYHVYADNFFTSPQLFLDLLGQGIYACGTIRQHRKGFPSELKRYVKSGLPTRGDSICLQSSKHTNLVACVWQDTKPVSVISTNAQSVPLSSVYRKQQNGTKKEYSCPEAVLQYNKFMGGVDMNDQLREYYSVRTKTRKNYKYLFWFVFDVAVTNAFILSKETGYVKTVKEFRSSLGEQLLEGYCSRKRKGRRPTISSKKFCEAHFPKYGDGKQHRCYNCIIKKRKKKQLGSVMNVTFTCVTMVKMTTAT